MTVANDNTNSRQQSSHLFIAVISGVSVILAALIGIIPFVMGSLQKDQDKQSRDAKPSATLVFDSIKVRDTNPKGKTWDSGLNSSPDIYVLFHNVTSGQKAKSRQLDNASEGTFNTEMLRIQQDDTVLISVYDHDHTNVHDKVGEIKLQFAEELWAKPTHELTVDSVIALRFHLRK